MSERSNWFRFRMGKEFSRILYPNPVCLLSTLERVDGPTKKEYIIKRNVMALSWVTPTNNHGRFMFSMNKSRYTMNALCPNKSSNEKNNNNDGGGSSSGSGNSYQTNIEFTLSIPIRGMEQLTREVGSASGTFGSKFHSSSSPSITGKTSNGVSGLIPVPLGGGKPLHDNSRKQFAIQGTVAHLKCRTYTVLGTTPVPRPGETMTQSKESKNDTNAVEEAAVIDDEHVLVMAEVLEAWVHPSYWDDAKLQFRPMSISVPPYLTFFGSWKFGYVTGNNANGDISDNDAILSKQPSQTQSDWCHFRADEEISQILNANPVCFLSTREIVPPSSTDMAPDHSAMAESTKISKKKVTIKRNVMVLSWLTPTNNHRRFVFSINKSRYTTTLLCPTNNKSNNNNDNGGSSSSSSSSSYQTNIHFTLSIPIQGMEGMIVDVGSVSGRFGSKFGSKLERINNETTTTTTPENSMSNRQKKKRRRQVISLHGVEGLTPVQLGSSKVCRDGSKKLFAIDGTVAHLKCRTYAVIGTPAAEETSKSNESNKGKEEDTKAETEAASATIDNEHLLVMAEIEEAYVHPSYWDDTNLLFRPLSTDTPPYLTFFGSQKFGYVVSGNDR
eukprot:CAMPEP_0183743036 /NCGR_PEP_ID=MMETSP0737-20130205/65010_1 /TAXON_ID=385413 /ORGANISM="Thalassiosira miniscula, Strain CCMP1093" /LENGTH=611 /DNA_ID=CAMNT_0025978639 /DNA_START=289 /DNA_END=2124 /DNA_ORIENTATION=+